VVIVTYASEKVLSLCVEALAKQTRPADKVVIVDNASPDSRYLDGIDLRSSAIIRRVVNDGFCGGNNVGFSLTAGFDYVLFLNPDAFLTPRFIEHALAIMEHPDNSSVGALTGTLLGFDINENRPSGRVDSTGIFRTWYGRWFDRSQGSDVANLPQIQQQLESLPAICGALMFCRRSALSQTSLNGAVFEPRFFMYKEDIELSLRLRKAGWRLLYAPRLSGYHCRGWQGRARMSARAKFLSTRNEVRVAWRYERGALLYALAKFLVVTLVEIPLQKLR